LFFIPREKEIKVQPKYLFDSMSYPDIKGKTYIVTGASSGMGRTTSLLLAKLGANVGLLDLRKPDAVAQEAEKLGGKALSLAVNVQDRDAVEQAVKKSGRYFWWYRWWS